VPVAELREEVNADPLGHPVTLRAQDLLEKNYADFGGPPAETLARWRAAGKRHLCFWPHGPLHFVPFHLLRVNGRPLADDWIVTTVSSSAQLRPREAPADERRRTLIVGSPYGGVTFGLPGQPGILDHVRALHAHLPEARLMDAGATPRAVMEAARDVEYIHIAAHGSQDVEAPWHQCLYLDAEEGGEGAGDGRLFAHQILTLDLRGVELVTLSACESALGRYDINDNHRGLPAAFLLAGAATVIGALWPVTQPVATLFFEELYVRLGAGDCKRDAFRRAQVTTRDVFPDYRDWGAFVLIGEWR
jgi:CHAT domain-containing protein